MDKYKDKLRIQVSPRKQLKQQMLSRKRKQFTSEEELLTGKIERRKLDRVNKIFPKITGGDILSRITRKQTEVPIVTESSYPGPTYRLESARLHQLIPKIGVADLSRAQNVQITVKAKSPISKFDYHSTGSHEEVIVRSEDNEGHLVGRSQDGYYRYTDGVVSGEGGKDRNRKKLTENSSKLNTEFSNTSVLHPHPPGGSFLFSYRDTIAGYGKSPTEQREIITQLHYTSDSRTRGGNSYPHTQHPSSSAYYRDTDFKDRKIPGQQLVSRDSPAAANKDPFISGFNRESPADNIKDPFISGFRDTSTSEEALADLPHHYYRMLQHLKRLYPKMIRSKFLKGFNKYIFSPCISALIANSSIHSVVAPALNIIVAVSIKT